MNVTVFSDKTTNAKVGDIVEFTNKKLKNSYYIICYNRSEEEYFLTPLTGRIRRITGYASIEELFEEKENFRIHTGEDAHLSLNLKS